MVRIRFGAWLVCENRDDGRKRKRAKIPKVHMSSETKGHLNSCLLQPPLQTCLADVHSDSVFPGRVLAWALVELDASCADTLLSPKSLERKILLEHFWFEPLVHCKILQAVPFQDHQRVVHTGTRSWPQTKIFEMHPEHVHWLLEQEVHEEAGVSLEEKLDMLNFRQYGTVTTSFQLWQPVALLASFGLWTDVSIPSFYQWSPDCSVVSSEETKHVVEQARYWANTRSHEKINKPVTEGIEVFGPADFNQLAASIVAWSGMLLNGAPFTKEVEQCRLEIAVQSCRTQAALLENIAAGTVLEQHHGTGRFNLVFLLQTLWLAFDLKSDSVLRQALLHAVKVLYPNTRHGFIEQIISDDTMPLPSRSILTQARFFWILHSCSVCDNRMRKDTRLGNSVVHCICWWTPLHKVVTIGSWHSWSGLRKMIC